MKSDANTARLAGAAFLLVLVTSAVGGALRLSVAGTGSVSDLLLGISSNLETWRFSTVLDLFTSVGIVILAISLYGVFKKQNKLLATVGLGWWLAEAITLAVSKLGSLALIPLSAEFVEAGAPASSVYQTLGHFFYHVLDRQGNDIHMLFYSLGAVLWFAMFLRARSIPRIISIPGLIIEVVGLGGMVLLLFGFNVSMMLFYPIAALELATGLWLLIKGTKHRLLA
jgi:hypothetical protein